MVLVVIVQAKEGFKKTASQTTGVLNNITKVGNGIVQDNNLFKVFVGNVGTEEINNVDYNVVFKPVFGTDPLEVID